MMVLWKVTFLKLKYRLEIVVRRLRHFRCQSRFRMALAVLASSTILCIFKIFKESVASRRIALAVAFPQIFCCRKNGRNGNRRGRKIRRNLQKASSPACLWFANDAPITPEIAEWSSPSQFLHDKLREPRPPDLCCRLTAFKSSHSLSEFCLILLVVR